MAFGDRGNDAPAPQQVAYRPAGIRFVAQHPRRCRARSARNGARDADAVEDLAEGRGIVDVAGREHNGQRQAPTVDREVDLGGQPAPGPAKGLTRLRAARIFRFVLV
ncbi:hypothetical protein GCM10010219_13660 [Streptomyces netropsis]|nr:hypothetical protein GCM10010219_13660 [Streptomyces netropsis]